MFQLQAPNIRFNHLDTCFKGYWVQRSPKVIQGHQGSLSVKNIKIAISHKLLNFEKSEACNISL